MKTFTLSQKMPIKAWESAKFQVAVASLESSGQLTNLSAMLDEKVGDYRTVVFITGILSAIIDNVPLVAAAQGMYPLGHVAASNVTIVKF